MKAKKIILYSIISVYILLSFQVLNIIIIIIIHL